MGLSNLLTKFGASDLSTAVDRVSHELIEFHGYKTFGASRKFVSRYLLSLSFWIIQNDFHITS